MINKLTYEEFYDYVWNEYISERIVTNSFLENNKDLVAEVTYDVYHVYKSVGNVSETIFAKILQQTFRNIVVMGVVSVEDNSINEAYDSF